MKNEDRNHIIRLDLFLLHIWGGGGANAKERRKGNETVHTHMPAWKVKHSDYSIKHQAWEHINAVMLFCFFIIPKPNVHVFFIFFERADSKINGNAENTRRGQHGYMKTNKLGQEKEKCDL